MNILSLFDGISCGQVALERANIKVDNYYASEIDKYAIKIAQKNYPDTSQLGDVKEVKGIKDIDLLIGGSPCQGFSFAGKGLNFDDPRSKLFFEYVRILKESNPKYFLLENVKMKKEYQDVISGYLGVEPIEINSALVSAQNRVRLYWTNIPGIKQPKDNGVVLKDIIQYGVVDKDKSYCIDANYFKGGNLKSYFEKHRRQIVFNDICTFREQGRRLTPDGTKRDDKNGKIIRGYEFISAYKSNNLSTVLKDNYLKEHDIYRKLTPIECERLQTLSDNYTEGVSNTQRYKILGNGWTVDVIAHILSYLK